MGAEIEEGPVPYIVLTSLYRVSLLVNASQCMAVCLHYVTFFLCVV
jgi:hypothetical protein